MPSSSAPPAGTGTLPSSAQARARAEALKGGNLAEVRGLDAEVISSLLLAMSGNSCSETANAGKSGCEKGGRLSGVSPEVQTKAKWVAA